MSVAITIVLSVLAFFVVVLIVKGIRIVPEQSVMMIERLGKFHRQLHPGLPAPRGLPGAGKLSFFLPRYGGCHPPRSKTQQISLNSVKKPVTSKYRGIRYWASLVKAGWRGAASPMT